MLLSIFLGGFIGALIALLRNMLRSGIKDSGQIENELDLPVYATVPRSPIQESRIKILKKKRVFLFLLLKTVMILPLRAYVVSVLPFTLH